MCLSLSRFLPAQVGVLTPLHYNSIPKRHLGAKLSNPARVGRIVSISWKIDDRPSGEGGPGQSATVSRAGKGESQIGPASPSVLTQPVPRARDRAAGIELTPPAMTKAYRRPGFIELRPAAPPAAAPPRSRSGRQAAPYDGGKRRFGPIPSPPDHPRHQFGGDIGDQQRLEEIGPASATCRGTRGWTTRFRQRCGGVPALLPESRQFSVVFFALQQPPTLGSVRRGIGENR